MYRKEDQRVGLQIRAGWLAQRENRSRKGRGNKNEAGRSQGPALERKQKR